MHKFVKRDASPNLQKGHPQLDRAARAAQAGVPVGGGRNRAPNSERQSNAQASTGLPSRGFTNAANTSASVVKQEPASQNIKVDVYDTDAESIDTTVNHSVIQPLENGHEADTHHVQRDHVSDSIPASDYSDGTGDEPWDEADDYQFTDAEVKYLKEHNLYHLGRSGAFAYLKEHYYTGQNGLTLRTVDGDSYPDTTEGDPTEAATVKVDSSDESDEDRSSSPSGPQRMPARQPGPVRTWEEGRTHNVPGQDDMIQRAQNIRDQRRLQPQFELTQRHITNNVPTAVLSSQPPTYSQAQSNNHPVNSEQVQVDGRPRLRGYTPTPGNRVKVPVSAPSAAPAPAPVPAPVPARQPAIPVVELSSSVPSLEHPDPAPALDYDHETLFAMKYDDLKIQSFDNDPHAKKSVLTEDLLDKPLSHRLDFVHRNLDTDKQAAFFESLPTNDWEDAGDWFLDQFNIIIRRTKEARQKRRKLAQNFEDEVAKRHKHVAKKHNQVEQAMDKMKAQGEGIIPKNPRPGRSLGGRKT